MAPQGNVLVHEPRGRQRERNEQYRPSRLSSFERSQVPDLSTFRSSDPVSCPVCHDFNLDEFPSLKYYTNPEQNVVSFSFIGLKLQSSNGCLGCSIIYTTVQRLRLEVRHDPGHRIVHDVMRDIRLDGRDPGFVSLTISSGGPATLWHYEAGGNRATTETYFVFTGRGNPDPWNLFCPVTLSRPGHALSEERRSLYDHWLTECIENHSQCQPTVSSKMPKRLINVGERNDPETLFLEENVCPGTSYVALSHTWRLSVPNAEEVNLFVENLEQRKQSIPWEPLSQTFKDAMRCTRFFGMQYIWIDSLCIAQNDENDWAEQSAQMADIYENAHFTIAGEFDTLRSSIHDGLWIRRERLHEIQRNDRSGKLFSAYAQVDDLPTYLDDPSLSMRGWCIQEKILSRRVFRFRPDDVVFECQVGRQSESKEFGMWSERYENQAMEFNPLGQPYPVSGALRYRRSEAMAALASSVGISTEDQDAYDQKYLWRAWHRIVGWYSAASLIFLTDKLPAVSGIASRFPEAQFGTYVAGLWSAALVEELFWHCDARKCKRTKREYIAPSFSWASVQGPCYYNDHLGGSEERMRSAELVDFMVTPSTSDPRGKISNAFVRLRTRVSPIRKDIYPDLPTEYSWENKGPYYYDTAEDVARYQSNGGWQDIVVAELAYVDIFGRGGCRSKGLLLAKKADAENVYERVGWFQLERMDDQKYGAEDKEMDKPDLFENIDPIEIIIK